MLAIHCFVNGASTQSRYQTLSTASGINQHVPLVIAGLIMQRVRSWNREARISDIDQLQFDTHTKNLMDVCGGCERILKSPITGSYKLLMWLGFTLYLVGIPWILVPTCDDATDVFAGFSACFFFWLEFLAEEVEEPFGTKANDLPLDSICSTIEKSVFSILETENQPD